MIGVHPTCKIYVYVCVFVGGGGGGGEIGDVVNINPSAAVETDLTAALWQILHFQSCSGG